MRFGGRGGTQADPCASTVANDDGTGPGARTFEAQLDDGRWMHISERRTKDGGYVSVGTDITKIKLHEQKAEVEGEKRQIATIADLRKSQEALQVPDSGSLPTSPKKKPS